MREELISLLPNLRRFALSLTGSMADADDLLQITVERVLSKGLPEGADVGKWAFRVCRNAWIDETRYRKIRTASDDETENSYKHSEDGVTKTMDRIALSQVMRAMQALPPPQREALALVAIEGFSYAEAAEALDVATGTIMSRVARARKALSGQFDLKDLLSS